MSLFVMAGGLFQFCGLNAKKLHLRKARFDPLNLNDQRSFGACALTDAMSPFTMTISAKFAGNT